MHVHLKVHLGKIHLKCTFRYISVHLGVHLGVHLDAHLSTFGEKIHLHTSERQLVNYIYVHLENWMYSDVNCWENPGKRNVHPGYI